MSIFLRFMHVAEYAGPIDQVIHQCVFWEYGKPATFLSHPLNGIQRAFLRKNMLPQEVKKSVIFIQPTIPRYREGFFEGLYERLGDRLVVHASNLDMGVISQSDKYLEWKNMLGNMRQILPGLSWQRGALDIDINQGDLIIVSGAPRCLTNIALLVKARRAGAKTMWWGHYWSSSSRQWRANLRLKLLRQADSALFYTDQEAEEFQKQFPSLPGFPVFALNNGIDNREIKQLRSSYSASKREKRVLFIGRLSEKSRLTLLLDALALEECTDVKLDIIGDGSALSALRQQAQNLGIGQRVVWHGGLADETKIAAIANRCRLFVYPGGVGLSLIHAMAYGLPVIVHNDRWVHMPEIAAFRENVNGVSFEKESASSLAREIASLVNNEDRLDEMSQEVIVLTDATYNTNDMVERFMAALATMENS